MKDIWNELENWTQKGEPFALARVIQTWGWAPRHAGSAMIVGKDMEVAGSVSGGCIEGAVIEAAQQVLQGGATKQLTYGVEDETAWSVGLSCGGEVSVLVERHWAFAKGDATRQVWETLRQAVRENRPAVLLTALEETEQIHLLIDPEEDEIIGDWGALTDAAFTAGRDVYVRRQNQVIELEGKAVFVQVFPRRDQLLIIGAGHITIPLVQFAQALEFETVVIDPRQVFATEERFPVAPDQLIAKWPEAVLGDMELSDDTYAVLLTHDPKIDDQALHILLKSPVRYIGALGSRKTHAKRCDRLREADFGEEEIGRIKGPAGLDIGAKTPAEIALSIGGEMVAARRSR